MKRPFFQPIVKMKLFTAAAAVLFGLSATQMATAQTNAPAPALRPNIVIVMMDDQRWDDFGFMGHTFLRTPHIDRIANEGVRFNNAFVTTPVSAASRTSFFTGQYPHTHGVSDDTVRTGNTNWATWPKLLRDAGYKTAFVGDWHLDEKSAPASEFDHLVTTRGGYVNVTVNVNGSTKNVRNDYITDVVTDYAVDFLKHDYDQPVCLVVSHRGPHGEGFVPPRRHAKRFEGAPVLRRPNYGAPRGKPALQRPVEGLPPLSEKTATPEEVIRNRWRLVAAVDESVERLFEILQDTGKLNNTLFILTSDQGYFYGEHGLSEEQRLAYDESIRVPLIMRFPRLIQPATANNALALNVDIAPTLLELAGAPMPPGLHGRSLLPLFTTPPGYPLQWRSAVLLEYLPQSEEHMPRIAGLHYQAIRTDGWKYIHYTSLDRADELYDLRWDPYEQKNLFWEPSAQGPLLKIQAELVRQVRETNLK